MCVRGREEKWEMGRREKREGESQKGENKDFFFAVSSV